MGLRYYSKSILYPYEWIWPWGQSTLRVWLNGKSPYYSCYPVGCTQNPATYVHRLDIFSQYGNLNLISFVYTEFSCIGSVQKSQFIIQRSQMPIIQIHGMPFPFSQNYAPVSFPFSNRSDHESSWQSELKSNNNFLTNYKLMRTCKDLPSEEQDQRSSQSIRFKVSWTRAFNWAASM